MSEFRQDPVTGDWVVLAPERAKRPHEFAPRKTAREASPKETCPFEDIQSSGNWPPILAWPSREEWRVAVIPNKYPALAHRPMCAMPFRKGPYELKTGMGQHDVVLTRDHDHPFALLSPREAFQMLRIIRERYRMLDRDPCLVYALCFHNWGLAVGASVYHPHYQILTLPVVPNHVRESLAGSERYFRKHKTCAHCDLLRHELRRRKNIIVQNKDAVALCPFASRREFEIEIFPKRHLPSFEKTPDATLKGFAEVMQETMKMIRRRLKDPDLNFYLHSAPLKNQARYGSYHWHVEIVPNLPPPPAGFELGSGMEINTMDPGKAAASLLGHRI